jgi:ligand-binding sensor domain-containing protein
LFFTATVVLAQHPISIKLDDSDGLPNTSFYDILEDSKGFIWLATGKGLYRYDGEKYINYTNDKLKGLSVFRLRLDGEDQVWCTSLSGQIFYVKNNQLELFIDLKEQNFKSIDLINFSILDDEIFFIDSDKTYSINKKDTKLKNVKAYRSKFINNQIINDTLFVFDVITKKINFFDSKIKDFLPYHKANFDKETSAKIYFFSFKNKFFCRFIYDDFSEKVYVKKENIFVPINKPKQLINKRIGKIKVIDNLVWVTTNKGVEIFDFVGDDINNKKTLFKDYKITNVLKDKQSNYWFTTLRDGIFVIPNIHLSLIEFPVDLNRVTDIDKIDASNFVFGTDTGNFGLYNLKTKRIETFKLKDEVRISELRYHPYLKKVFISTDNISYIFDIKTKKISDKKQLFLNAKGLSVIDSIKILYSNHTGSDIIVVNRDSIETNTLRKGKRAYTSYHSIKNKTSYVAYVDNLIAYDKFLKSEVILFNNKAMYVVNITETADGNIWVSTFKNGIFGIRNNKVFINYTIENGLITNQPKGIRGDGTNLWIVTDKGIQLLDTKKKSFRLLTRSDGVLSYSIFDIQVYKDNVLFASNKGLFFLNKKNIFKDKLTPKPYFESISIADNKIAIAKEYTLKYNQNKINIKFNTTGFRSINNTIYQYKMLGFSDKWQTLSKGVNEVSFNSLPYGDCHFLLRVKNGDKFSSVKEIKFHVKEVFYKKGWFIILLFLLFTFLLNKYYHYQLSEKEKVQKLVLEKKQNDLENVALKLENLRSQMNPHFIFNALNSIQEFIITNNKNLASDFLGKFADLIREYLEQSNKSKIPLFEEINTLEKYLELEKLRFEDTFNYRVNLIDKDECEHVLIPTMLIQPFVENALKHGLLHKKNNRRLIIDFYKEQSFLICKICDNGVGRKRVSEIHKLQNRQHTSFATRASQDRLKLMNFDRNQKISIDIIDLYDEVNNPIGTEVIIKIPIC